MQDVPSHFGPYEIISPLGAGGMGQVYRARDTRLQRFVAVKILHDGASGDPDRQRRFAQEAIAASALNHPNILTVYDVGADGDSQFLVSELIEGESLRAEMNRGRIPLKRVIEIAQQIREGLAAAHDAGIVHRDLKPENVMVMPDGRVKIVDFGLAKTADAEAGLLGEFTATKTAEGLIMGTVPYMSQARGGAADFRSDQFALGVILYELTTSTHPFKRETAVQTLSAIIADDPPDPAQIAPSLPVAVRWLIRRLLSKNPRQRFASTSDLAADLRTIRDYLSEATSSVATAIVAPPRPIWQIRAAVSAIVFAGLVALVWALTPPDLPDFDKYTPFATGAGYQSAPAWAPDGKAIAYEADVNGVVQIFVRTLGAFEPTQVTHSPINDCYVSAWARDGYIYYHSRAHDTDGLYRISPVGGTAEPMIEGAARSAISPDGKTVFFLRGTTGTDIGFQLWSASLPDTEHTERRYPLGPFNDKRISGGYLRFSPDGSKLLMWLGPDSASNPSFWEIPVAGGKPRSLFAGLVRAGSAPPLFSWVDNRYVVLTRADGPTPGGHLWLADTRTDHVTPITTTPGNEGSPSVSPDGHSIAFTWDATDFDLVEVPLNGSPVRTVVQTTRDEFDPAVSPTSEQFAFVTNRTGYPEIWLQNKDSSRPLVTPADFDGVASMAVGALAFSRDGTRLAFQLAAASETSSAPTVPGGFRIWVTAVGGGKPFPIGATETYQDAPTWSPNSDWIAYLTTTDTGYLSLVKSQVGTRGSAIRLSKTGIPPFLARPQWSPDGNWILCETTEGLSLIASDGSLRSKVVAEPGWFAYAWDSDGRRVYGLVPSEDLRQIMFVSVDVQSGESRVINPNVGFVPQALQPIRGFSRYRSGFLTSIAHVRSDIYLIEGFQLPRRWWERMWRLGRSN
jgi:serine/threonine protein kinase/Tol biopolymer transport system component